jgi:hypothetical protein
MPAILRVICLLLLWMLFLPSMLCAEELAPWKSNRHPSDVRKEHVQDIKSARLEYRIVQAGTMDGRNCRSPQGVWTPFEQTWESNRSVRMENVGQTDVVNPWLSNGRNDFRSIQAIVDRAIEPAMTDKEKATALWWQQVQHRFHFEGDNRELASPVKVFNVYGHNTCGNDSICMAGLWKTAGLKVAPARLVGHCVTQVFFDGGWRLFDGDMHSMYLLRDNETIAGEQDLVRDHDLIKRTHTQGILRPQGRAGDEWEASIYVFEGDITGDRNADGGPEMNMTLRPGEALVWRWGHTEPAKYFGSQAHKFTERICNGLWEYRPDFANATWRKGADRAENIVSGDEGLKAEEGKTAIVEWSIRCPYVIVGGKLDIDGTGARFEISWDGKTWDSAGRDLDSFFPPIGTARYSYHLRCQLTGAARLRSLRIVNDLQMAPLSLPEMGIGENHFSYTDESPAVAESQRNVRITHHWVERSASAPPAAPLAPIRPRDRGDAEGTDVVFEWQPAVDPDGDKIADYHFELSARPDMKWPLSMSFARLISRTSDAGSARFTLKAPGELNPDRQYYWHIRAQDDQGVWGPWSKTWIFTPRGPAPPLEVAMQYDREKNLGILRWTPNRLGRRPVAYRIYASDEKGFTASDEPFQALTGIYNANKGSKETSTQFPANFLMETKAAELAVVGEEVTLDGANKAFYRVVAVDEAGNRSGPSDYAAAPRPVIYSRPLQQARLGEEYRYDVRAIRSLGDLRTRVVDGREVMNYWDVEKPRFLLEKGPQWLAIDEATGRLSGKPDTVGRTEIVVTVKLERERRKLDPAALQWGIEKSLDSGVETVGTAKQTFVVQTAP